MSSAKPEGPVGRELAVGGAGGLMLPPPPRLPAKRKEVVLEEDDWTATLEAIIERDFFPELPKLESKIAWLQAVRSGDPEQIRQAQLLIAQRRAAGGAWRPHTGATPANAPLFTPGGTAARALQGDTPYIPLLPPGVPLRGGSARPDSTRPGTRPTTQRGAGAAEYMHAAGLEAAAMADLAPPVSLDQFMAHHTSEDNASFQEILEDTNKRKRHRYAAQLVAQSDPQLLLTEAGREKTDGFGTSGQQPDTLIGWPFQPKNALYYDGANREVVPFTDKEMSAMVQGPPKEINHSNTRFSKDLLPSSSATPSSSSAAGGSAAAGAAFGGAAAQPPVPGARAAVAALAAAGGTRGYSIMATPVFEPGAEETPFVTWGDIEATPLRIEAEDLPPGPYFEGGPSFYIKQGSRKEQKGHELASKVAAALRKRGGGGGLRGSTPAVTGALAAAAAARRQATGGSGVTARPSSGQPPTLAEQQRQRSGKPLSAAAQKLAGALNRGRVRPDTDSDLRASYRGATPGTGQRRPTGQAGVGGTGRWSAAPTPGRSAAPGPSPAVHATLEEEELRLQALLKVRAKEAQQHKELEAAREAAKRAFQQPPAAGGSGSGRAAAAPDLTSGLLNI